MVKYEILKVRDKTDSYYIDVPGLPNINFKIAIIGASQRSGKTTVILNMLIRVTTLAMLQMVFRMENSQSG